MHSPLRVPRTPAPAVESKELLGSVHEVRGSVLRRVEARIWRAVARLMRSATGDLPREDGAMATRMFAELRIRLAGPPANVHWEVA
ncbi:MAG: hypothetical protein WB789_06895 [Thermoplasmata archaeon]